MSAVLRVPYLTGVWQHGVSQHPLSINHCHFHFLHLNAVLMLSFLVLDFFFFFWCKSRMLLSFTVGYFCKNIIEIVLLVVCI